MKTNNSVIESRIGESSLFFISLQKKSCYKGNSLKKKRIYSFPFYAVCYKFCNLMKYIVLKTK